MTELLLAHAFFLADDAREREVMRPHPPLGILCLAAYLRERGVPVSVFDGTFRAPEEFEAVLARERPAVVGLSVNLLTRPRAVAMVRAARAAGARVVLGGPEPIAYAEEYLARGADVVVGGEGEETLLELLPRLREGAALDGVRGIAFRRGQEVVRTPPRPLVRDLDALPLPARDLVDLGTYLAAWQARHGFGCLSLFTARGCPYQCRWCSHGVFGFTHRRRSPARVADELQALVETWRPEQVWYADDVFTIHPGWLRAYADELDRRRLHVPFEAISREDRLNAAVVDTLARLGCRRLWLGAESGSQRVLDAMQRGTDAARVPDMVRLLQSRGIEAGLFVMLGYEGETQPDLQQTAELLVRAAPDAFLTTVAYPIKGTPYHEEVAGRLEVPADWERSTERAGRLRGRRSPRYYRFATRWLVNEVAWRGTRTPGLRRARAFLSAQVGRLGMALSG